MRPDLFLSTTPENDIFFDDFGIHYTNCNFAVEIMVLMEMIFGDVNVFNKKFSSEEIQKALNDKIKSESNSNFSYEISSQIFNFIKRFQDYPIRNEIPIKIFEGYKEHEFKADKKYSNGFIIEFEREIIEIMKPHLFHFAELYHTNSIKIRGRVQNIICYINFLYQKENHIQSNTDFVNFFNALDIIDSIHGESLVDIFNPCEEEDFQQLNDEYKQFLKEKLNLNDEMVEYEDMFSNQSQHRNDIGYDELKFFNALFLYLHIKDNEDIARIYNFGMEFLQHQIKNENVNFNDECEILMKRHNINF